MQDIFEKYNDSVIKNLNEENLKKIVSFLEENNCPCIEDIITDYLDLFTIEYDEFVRKYKILNEKYNHHFLEKVSEDMNLLEELYLI